MTILWDWNGTLLSDVPLVVRINNEVFARHGYRLTSEEEYRRIFRFPVKDYYTDIGVTDEDFPLVAKEWNEGFHQAIISASQVDQLRAQVVKFPELDGMFDDILGLGDVYAVSKVQLAKDYLSRKGYDPADTVFLGDTSHDAEVARAIGCRCLLISGGHQCDAVLRQVPGVEVLPSLRAAADVLGA